MAAVRMWVALDLRRRWVSLVVLALLVALAGGTIMAALAGARRGNSAFERLQAHTLPAAVGVFANTPGFDWGPVRRLPQVEAMTTFVVDYQLTETPSSPDGNQFPPADDQTYRTIEKPVVYAGRVADPHRADEVMVSRSYVSQFHRGVGDEVTLHLPTPAELAGSTEGQPLPALHGPNIQARIVGVIASPWNIDGDGVGVIFMSPGLAEKYPANVVGPPGSNVSYVNALVRLRGGDAEIPAFRAAFVKLTHRPDIYFFNLAAFYQARQRHAAFESDCLAAFGLAVLAAALFLIGPAIARYTAGAAGEVETLRALGLTRRQAVLAAAAPPTLAGIVGALLAVAAAVSASPWFPIGSAARVEPDPGVSFDPLVLPLAGVGIIALVLLAGLASAALALGAGRRQQRRRPSAVALAAARAGLGVPVLIGARFALEPGRGRTAVPVRPALIGAIAGVIGVVAAFTFSHAVTDASNHPERFGQTYDLTAFVGINDQNFAPQAGVYDALAKSGDVAGLDDARTSDASPPRDQDPVPLYQFDAGPKPLPVVLLSGRLPRTANEITLGPRTLSSLHLKVGDSVPLSGNRSGSTFQVVGTSLIPEGPHNTYTEGGWITGGAYDHIFKGFKFRIELLSLRPGADADAAAVTLKKAVVAAVPQAKDLGLSPGDPPTEVGEVRQVRKLPLFLGGFLALLAVGAVGHGLATAVRRRRVDIAVLRALGMTRRQSRGVVITQASVLGLIGLVFGLPLGVALGRVIWRVVADYTPLQYVSPLSVTVLLVAVPATVVLVNLLAAWPGHQAARLRVAHVLRAE